ncbi:sensor histidine kinase [Nocardioides marinquilinus]|uniref:sensor histidine kinase n=1 Tax=Nocardioides marinquilinus TaxID=1210400 RepID=UPI0031EDCC7E
MSATARAAGPLVTRRGVAVADVDDGPGPSVARLVTPVVWRLGAIIAAVGLVCVGGILVSVHGVDRIDARVEQARLAQQQVSVAIGDLESLGVRGGRAGAAERGAAVRERLEAALSDLSAAVGPQGDLSAPDLDAAVATQQVLAAAWLADGAPPLAVDDPRYVELRTAGAATSSALTERSRAGTDRVVLWLYLTALAAAAAAGLGWLVVARSRVRLQHEIAVPLQDLERVVHRMLPHEHDRGADFGPESRADDGRGPSEVRAVARALNDFADAQSRARAVESRIRDELHVLDSAKDDFVSNVSHELRTPLTTISGYLEMVADEFDGRLDARHDRMLEATRRNVVRLRHLIDDLLALSTAESRPAEAEPVDVVEMIAGAVTDVRMTAARRGIAVELLAPDGAVRVVGARAPLHRAFANLLSNAVKFSHDGGTVEVGVVRARGHVELTVRDRGIGIPADELDRLGTRFFRASNARSNEIAGTGLGLRIVQTIIDHHHGDVVIESAEGEGTTVVVRLRLADASTGRAAGPTAAVGAGTTAGM